MSEAGSNESKNGSWVLLVAALAVGIGSHQLIPALRDGSTWALITTTVGVYGLGNAVWALIRQRKAPSAIWPAWPAALMAVATLAAGAAGGASLRQKTDEANLFVDKAFSGQERDTEHAAIQTAYFRYVGYGTGRTCAAVGLGLGAVSLALALASLERARRAQRKRSTEKETGPSAATLWIGVCGVMGAAALAANVAAIRRPVPAAEDPEIAEAALITRRFDSGDVAGACRVLEPALESSKAAAEALGRRLPDLARGAKQCVDFELGKAKKLGPGGCESVVGLIGPMRFVQVAGAQEAVAAACPVAEEPR
ncbi:MAG: hypothetical protein HY898_08525 [Deltaproteobacteria bacterium]|nr:hypothetical protein [Deltaproteobacteria bacterium]